MQLNLVEAERQLLHTQLAFTQASIEPRFLIDTLGRIERLYEIDVPAADNLLNELVGYLRAAIPREQSSSSSVTREIHITNAYLKILRLQTTPCLVAKDEGASVVSHARMPPMVLLPLIQHALAHRGKVVVGDAQFPINAAVHGETLLITIHDQGSGFAPDGRSAVEIMQVCNRLTALYGDCAKLIFSEVANGTKAVLEIPYETIENGAFT